MAVDWIAEVGSMHKGQVSLAYRMVQEFSAAGATTIKFQAGRDPNDPIRYADDFLPFIFGACEVHGVEFLASCWSMAGLNMCRDLGMKRRKIAHQQVSVMDDIFLETLEDEVETIVSVNLKNSHHMNIKTFLTPFDLIKWLFVGDYYPTYPWDFNPPLLMSQYDGYSNHVHGIAAPLWAVAHGAKIVECHVTLDPTEHTVKDNHFALTPQQFAQMVRIGNDISRLGEAHV
ncbi:MAG: N-acetylneuraminate synthase family protein [Candidatus Thorarchaeota archaeon]|jgi:N-acetylneuraminate synthase